ncbi:MAG: hypothetical protein WD733_06560 [Bryobacterales bacterium]
MSKESKVRAVTMIVIAVAALLVIGRKAGWELATSGGLASTAPQKRSAPQAGPGPQDTIYRMLDAAGRGDTGAYIECYGGAMRRRIEQSRDEMSAGGFARYLAENNQQIKGFAVAEPKTLSGGEVEVRVEFIYQDRNEAQQFLLAKSAGEWTITRVSTAERIETLVPYGTPVH